MPTTCPNTITITQRPTRAVFHHVSHELEIIYPAVEIGLLIGFISAILRLVRVIIWLQFGINVDSICRSRPCSWSIISCVMVDGLL